MLRKRLLWKLLPSYLLLLVAALLLMGWLTTRSVEEFCETETSEHLHKLADLLDAQIGNRLDGSDQQGLQDLCDRQGRSAGIWVTILRPSGEPLIEPKQTSEFADQGPAPEVVTALSGRLASHTRYNSSLRRRVVYLAMPLWRDGKIAGALRLAAPATTIDVAVRSVLFNALITGLVLVSLAVLLGWLVARWLGHPLEHLSHAAQTFARGDLRYRLPVPEGDDLAELADSWNQMADQLETRIQGVLSQNHQQEAVLASMIEGVLAVDNDQRVISVNNAAARLLGKPLVEVQGRNLQEVIRNADLRQFVADALVCRQPIEGDVVLHNSRDRVLQANGTALRDPRGNGIGAVIVMNDVSRLRQLENMRRDFAANVSHELKTPIASIKGFVETLLDGAMNQPADAERFLRIVARQTDRLNVIIEDLLSLSKIEKEAESGDMELEPAPLQQVLESAFHNCEIQAVERNIHVVLDCDSELLAKMKPDLLEQAVTNLLDNAIKYSEPGREVQVRGERTSSEIMIHVHDQGSGIAVEHLPRIFERFYRVDKARSRKLGGTGLGLAIVKHIVNAHRGHVTVVSTLGSGSTFTIHLPLF
jgi:two-component system phosphate regulon sensor histidine kinase PhoR